MATDPVTYPPDPASVSGTTITTDVLLSNPKFVQRHLQNITLQNFYVDRIFADAGNVSTGAVVYDQLTTNELYANRDVQRVEPGEEAPIIDFNRVAPLTAQSEKFAGKFPVTDEQRRRTQFGRVERAMLQLANTVKRKTQQRALSELSAAVSTFTRTASGTGWATAAALTNVNRSPAITPINDLTLVEKSAETDELGYSYNLAIMNPQEWRNFRLAAGGDSALAKALLSDSGINDVWVTNRKTAGTVYWVAEKMVGEFGYEIPPLAEQWRDANGRQQDWYQYTVLPIVYVTDPFAILETTGHAA